MRSLFLTLSILLGACAESNPSPVTEEVVESPAPVDEIGTELALEPTPGAPKCVGGSLEGFTGSLRGDTSRICGELDTYLTGDVSDIRGWVGRGVHGDVSDLSGSLRCLTGDIGILTGDVSALSDELCKQQRIRELRDELNALTNGH